MSAGPLTKTYRPQTFAAVVGQTPVRTILSRAAAENQVAPAYLFSGTRGVGKTTVARILAKAINCEKGPASEPCNACRYCREITQGMGVDVVEIDGASHTGVDHVRKLKEDVGYAPLSCRYKVIIIDEAHMLSKAAFNALLKTLEEPPPQAVFILATTEPHRFPATIISRCQHHIFQRLSQEELSAHLRGVLNSEGIAFEEEALRLIVRKGAGSVRDAMSLLAQVLALGQSRLESAHVREVLGLAGQETLLALFEALRDRDCLAINTVLRSVLDQGLDLAFFLRELTATWRNLFLLKQSGEKAFSLLDLAEEEARQWLHWSETFSAGHIHACWQMTLEGQRRVLTSVEPALALELLLLNLAFLEDLVPLGQASRESEPSGSSSGPGTRVSRPGGSASSSSSVAPDQASVESPAASEAPAPEATQTAPEVAEPPQGAKTWQGFVQFCQQAAQKGEARLPALQQVRGDIDGDTIRIHCQGRVQAERFTETEKKNGVQNLAQRYFERPMQLEVHQPSGAAMLDRNALKQEVLKHPAIQEVLETFQAQLVEVHPKSQR
ncbi:MAG: DNA polymerase III subunit gamma/tau [Thermodesulfobacteriota bacterium]